MSNISDADLQMFCERAKTELASGCDVSRLRWDDVVEALCNEVADLRLSLEGRDTALSAMHEALDEAQVGNQIAQWLNGKNYEYEFAYCSACGRMEHAGWDTHQQAKEEIGKFYESYKYCPGCGAKMTGGMYVE